MADVRSFPGVKLVDTSTEPVAEVVKYLEELLAKAEAGHIRAIAFSYVRENGRPSYGWSGIKSGDIRMFALHSGLCTAVTDMGREMADSSDDVDANDPSEA